MLQPKSAHQLARSQVATPERVVSLVWDLIRQRRSSVREVLDMGAGDCRFARGGHFTNYFGVEIDETKAAQARREKKVRVIIDCVFRHSRHGYDVCIGNPPYVRHHDVRSPWKEKAAARLETELGITLDKHCNLFLYFLCLALLKTHGNGLIALVIPYEWVSRPSAEAIRQYIRNHKWTVDVYRFRMPIFNGVITTASITIIDKLGRNARWSFFDIDHEYRIHRRSGPAESEKGVLKYSGRGVIWAMRGLSPGSQEVFTLTEGERIHYGLGKTDVVPCVTTLIRLPRTVRTLSKAAFTKYFIDKGERCWLIKSDRSPLSDTLNAYLKSVPEGKRNTFTCVHQTPWFRYKAHPAPRILISSGFTTFGPKVLINSVGAVAVGSVFGIHSKHRLQLRRLQRHLLAQDFEKQLVSHARTLKKLEVRQLNSVLNSFAKKGDTGGKATH